MTKIVWRGDPFVPVGRGDLPRRLWSRQRLQLDRDGGRRLPV